LRSYQFMAEGLAELPQAFAARGIAWTLRVGDPSSLVPKVVQDLGAEVLVTDLDPLRTARGWKAAVAESVTIPVVAVATDAIVPPSSFPNLEYAARTIRTKRGARWRADHTCWMQFPQRAKQPPTQR
jgi:deoxyribodipyrimidine photo-lyase